MKEKSKEIVLIAPYNDLYEKAVTILQRQEYANIEVVLANLDEGLSAARQKMGQGAKVIISRGGTFLLLRDVLRIPMVEIVITGYDLLASYPELMKLTEPLA
ncbi:MAG: PrpR N-terminal domain-containing protein, partial [Sphaerochaeta sp.]